MAIDPKSLPLKEAFSLFAKGNITKDSIRLWDSNLYRETRLLVPVDVQAMVVTKNKDTEHAHLNSVDYLALQGRKEKPSPNELIKKPFKELKKRKAGVYLHWALPDALTAGELKENADQLSMPVLPNRWVVMRMEQGEKRKVTAWVIESDLGRATPLADWQESNNKDGSLTPRMEPKHLTVDVASVPTWTVMFDTAENRFAYYDNLEGLETGGLVSYLVTGWYSNEALDPLAKATTITRCSNILKSHGWEVNDAQFKKAQDLNTQRHKEHSALNLKSSNRFVGSLASGIGVQRADNLVKRYQVDSSVNQPTLRIKPVWPQQSIFHGVIYDVSLRSSRNDNRPKADSLKITIGHNNSESLAKLVASSQARNQQDSFENLHLAFQYKMTDVINDTDGLAKLEAAFHKRSYDVKDGGYITEVIREGDPFAHIRPSHKDVAKIDPATIASMMNPSGSIAAVNAGFADTQINNLSNAEFIGGRKQKSANQTPTSKNQQQKNKDLNQASRVSFNFSSDKRYDAFTLHAFKREHTFVDNTKADKQNSLHYKEVKRPMPRWFTPLDPVITIRGLKRNLRHGYDGRFDEGEKLNCRLSGNHNSKIAGLIEGKALLAERFDFPNVPPEVKELLYEAVINDPTIVAIENISKRATKLTKQSKQNVTARIAGEAQLKIQIDSGHVNAAELVRYSLKDGVMASPQATTLWKQPWIPLQLEWEIIYLPSDHHGNWQLNELDFKFTARLNKSNQRRIQGRSLLNSSNAKSLSSSINQFLDAEDILDQKKQGVIDKRTEAKLRKLNKDSLYADTLNASLEGFADHLLGFDSNISLDGEPPLPSRVPELLMSGHAQLTKLRIIDAFGRVLNVPKSIVENIDISSNLRSEKFKGIIELQPRILQPVRLWFRFVDAENDSRDAHINQSAKAKKQTQRNPIAGWLLADHVDRALEVFSGSGKPLGQLRHVGVDNAITWEGVPGKSSLGVSPVESINNSHVAEFARSMVELDSIKKNNNTDGKERETLLNALLRVIDTTLWTSDPFGSTGNEFYSSLTGRPIAVVRARLKLDVNSDLDAYKNLESALKELRKTAYEKLYSQKIDVRLGALERFDDGLLGYFVNDDYSNFHPVHKSVPKQAIVAGRFKGFASSIDKVPSFAKTLQRELIKNNYIEKNPKVSIRTGQSVSLTLLMDPGSSVHATSGILPRKSISLPRIFVESALAKMAPSFRFGPVLVDPKFIRMPKPKGLPEEQIWTRRDSQNSWKDDPITAATQEALLPDTSAQAQEGFIRISVKDEES